jgi:hypothetical protein
VNGQFLRSQRIVIASAQQSNLVPIAAPQVEIASSIPLLAMTNLISQTSLQEIGILIDVTRAFSVQ